MGATLAFWMGNPILNPATMIFMGFVLGWQWVGLRIVVGVILVFGVAWWAGRLTPVERVPEAATAAREAAEAAMQEPQGSLLAEWGRTLWQLVKGLLPEYLIIVLALGAARAWLFPDMTPAIGHSVGWLIFFALAGTVFVIPTAGEIPIVQSLMQFGLGPASAGVLLTTLPPVSLPSLFMVGRAIPARTLTFVSICVVLLGLLSGMAAGVLHF